MTLALAPTAYACRVCCAPEYRALWTVKGYTWVRCQHCGSVATLNLPTPQQLDDFYNDGFYSRLQGAPDDKNGYIDYIGQRPFIQGNFHQRMQWAARWLGPGAGRTWLDIGCAAGFLLDEARLAGFAPYGLDYSDYGPRFARSQLQMPNVRQGTVDQMPADFPATFDVISFFDVIEHMLAPREMLELAAARVPVGGYLLGETFDPGNLLARLTGSAWHIIEAPYHLTLFTPQGLDKLMAARGFSRVASTRLGRWLSLGSLATKFGRPGRWLAEQIHRYRLDRAAIPIWTRDAVLWIYQRRA